MRTAGLICALLIPVPLSAADEKPKGPNVLFLMADDFRPDAIAAFGHPAVQTPNLDALVNRGFVFRNAYCLGSNSGAVCMPSRNMFLSGRAYSRWKGGQAPAEPSFPVSMKAAGYETYHHGKRGNTAQLIQAKFDQNKYLEDQKERTSGEPGKRVVDDAITFLKERDGAKPLFMYLAFESPHDPRVAAKQYMDLYDRSKIPVPKNYLPLHPFDNGEQLVRDELLASFPRTEDEIRKHLHDYYAVITALDGHIGRLIAALKERGQLDSTLIIFSSDHGLALGSHGLMGKQSLYEHSMKSPLIFAGPGIPKVRSDALAYLFDIFPTVCDLVGAETPQGLDGKSLRSVIEKKSDAVRDVVFLSYRDVQRAVRDQRWKLIRYPHINYTQLFDLASDPDELKNLADDPAQAKRVEAMLGRLTELQKQYGDSLGLTSENPRSKEFVPPTGEELDRLKKGKKK